MLAGNSKDPQGAALRRMHCAVADGRLSRPEHCEICGKTEDEVNADIEVRRGHATRVRHVLIAHHWRGYGYVNALDVWWVCTMCNGMLWGYHDGSLTLEEARAMWRTKQGVATVALAGGRMLRVRPEGNEVESRATCADGARRLNVDVLRCRPA
jgi:hypothetical protein